MADKMDFLNNQMDFLRNPKDYKKYLDFCNSAAYIRIRSLYERKTLFDILQVAR